MRGQILVISDEKQVGAIATPDGQRVMFRLADWQDVVPPQRGMEVTFSLDADKRVRLVQLAMPSQNAQTHTQIHAQSHTQAHAVHAPQAQGQTQALQPPAHSLSQAPKRKSVLTLFALLLGWAGAHRFYMGAWGWGLIQLLALPFFAGLLMLLVPALGLLVYLLLYVLVMVEIVRYIWWTDDEFEHKVKAYQANRPGPFSFFW